MLDAEQTTSRGAVHAPARADPQARTMRTPHRIALAVRASQGAQHWRDAGMAAEGRQASDRLLQRFEHDNEKRSV